MTEPAQSDGVGEQDTATEEQPKPPPSWFATAVFAFVLTVIFTAIAARICYVYSFEPRASSNLVIYEAILYAVVMVVVARTPWSIVWVAILTPLLVILLVLGFRDVSPGFFLHEAGVEQQAIVGDLVENPTDACLKQNKDKGVRGAGGKFSRTIYAPDGDRLDGGVPGTGSQHHEYRRGDRITVLVDPQHRLCVKAEREVGSTTGYVVWGAICTVFLYALCWVIAWQRRDRLGKRCRRLRNSVGADSDDGQSREVDASVKARGDSPDVLAANVAGKLHRSQLGTVWAVLVPGVVLLIWSALCSSQAWNEAHDPRASGAIVPAIAAVLLGALGLCLTVIGAIELALRRVNRVEGQARVVPVGAVIDRRFGRKKTITSGDHYVDLGGRILTVPDRVPLPSDGRRYVGFVMPLRNKLVNLVPADKLPVATSLY